MSTHCVTEWWGVGVCGAPGGGVRGGAWCSVTAFGWRRGAIFQLASAIIVLNATR